MVSVRKGFVCMVDGADGMGKSTLCRNLLELFKKSFLAQIPAITNIDLVKEPEYLIEEIKATPMMNWLKLTYLFIRQREMRFAGEFGRKVRNELCIYVQDRGYTTTCVYESLLGGVTPITVLDAHGDWLVKPNVIMVLDLPDLVAESRLVHRTSERIAQGSDKQTQGGFYRRVEDLYFQQKVRDTYRSLIGSPVFGECVLVDADKPPQQLAQDVFEQVMRDHLVPWLKMNGLPTSAIPPKVPA